MHHLKETVIDGVKFVLIPEGLHDKLALLILLAQPTMASARLIASMWTEYDPEIFNAL